jgi:hypothetical protein
MLIEQLSNSGYHACPCRDCFEVAIGCDDDNTPHLCNSCEESGCDATGESDCDAPHAYCAGDSRHGEGDVMIDGVAYCPVCGLEF